MLNRIFIFCLLICISACVPKATSPKNKSASESTVAQATPTPFATTVIPTLPPTPMPTQIAVDPYYSQSWHLRNTGQATYSKNSGVSGIDLNLGSQIENGSGVLIAVSDAGVQKDHPDLVNNFSLAFSKNYALASPYFGDPVHDGEAHGTAVSGIIAASKDNGLGTRGIASGATLAGLRYIGAPYSLSKQVDQANGQYDIFNYSYGGYTCYFDYSPAAFINQLEYGVKNLRGGKGAIYVKAGGNEFYSRNSDCDPTLTDDDDTYYFGNANLEEVQSYPWMIVTAAVNASGISSSYSTPGSSLWISAPGGEYGVNYPAIVTTDLTGCDAGYAKDGATRNDFESGGLGNNQCDYTSVMNGTSASAPMVSGVVALLLHANPNLSWRDIKYILAKTARKIDPNRGATTHPAGQNLSGHTYQLGWITNAAGYNFHNWYGFGMVNASAAIAMAKNYTVNLGTFRDVTVQSAMNLNRDIPDASATGLTHTISVSQNMTIEAVQIKLNVTHPYVGDLGVELTSPSGTKSLLMNINSGINVQNIEDDVLLTNAFYGENANGQWRLKIVDGLSQDSGNLNHWSIKVYGR